jgi:hypothetical protein
MKLRSEKDGVVFFPDKSRAFSKARHVLRPGGVFLFTAWDRIDHNEFADTVTDAEGLGWGVRGC